MHISTSVKIAQQPNAEQKLQQCTSCLFPTLIYNQVKEKENPPRFIDSRIILHSVQNNETKKRMRKKQRVKKTDRQTEIMNDQRSIVYRLLTIAHILEKKISNNKINILKAEHVVIE